jgi:hypothetical protein
MPAGTNLCVFASLVGTYIGIVIGMEKQLKVLNDSSGVDEIDMVWQVCKHALIGATW